MPVEHQTPPHSGGSDPAGGVASGLDVRAQVEAVLRELGVTTWPAVPQDASAPSFDVATLTGDVDEDIRDPGSITQPVLAVGDTLQLALKKEVNRGRVITILLGIFGLAIAGTVVASFRLPAEQGVKQLNDLSNTLLVVVVGAIAYYFGRKTP
jgi:uncharacterized membrane protein YeaQ/YmgE (transglycosylase-associated protein family)